ncbi:restriction endonuclease subunit S [Alkalicoccus halolimnae]|uniref:Restriction endonuclease subunit S n=1 Tax=Alkalicoccus halolimnae TaxID=1667239 RepID=A0A5C7F3Q9_9BACI|nr:restriction endonuclease subunit S [Alkalicoccus halolimnae]TXF85301.1 restriction endonuclease subunit S [Alkalicoccus halolimnae]
MKSNNVPEVRFEGFSDEWDQRELGDVSVKVTEKNKDKKYSETLTNSAEFGIISQGDYFDKKISNDANIDGYYVVSPNDFVYNPRISSHAPVGPIKRNKLNRTGVMSPLYYVFSVHGLDEVYLEKYFETVNWHKFMKLNGDSGARSDRFAIKDTIFKMMPIPNPNIEEQQKIGQFFKQLDDRISLQQRQIELLKESKQGFLQKMFPKDGERVPEVRFDGFHGDWSLIMIGDVAEIVGGGTPNTTIDEYWNGNVNWFSPAEIGEQRFLKTSRKKITDLGLQKSSAKLLPVGTILFTSRAGIGNTAILVEPASTNQGFQSIVPKQGELDTYFIYSMSGRLKKYGEINGAGSTFTEISGKQLAKMKMHIPNIEEQQKIGEFFKQLDDNIALHEKELELLKETKKGFLQKMFV